MKKSITALSASLLAVLFPVSNAFAAISALNNNVRIFEDSIWLAAFTLIIVAGRKLKKLSNGGVKIGYWFLILAGSFGWCWKGIGLVKRVLIIKQPEWFFTLTRETVEGLTGIILAIAFLVLVLSIRNVQSHRADAR